MDRITLWLDDIIQNRFYRLHEITVQTTGQRQLNEKYTLKTRQTNQS